MGRACTVCTHSNRPDIDAAIVDGEAVLRIATRYGLAEPSVRRHAHAHIAPTLAKATPPAEQARADSLLDRLRSVGATTLEILAEARKASDGELALRAIARVERQIELQAKMLGELSDAPTVSVLVAPEWLAIRARVLVALEAHPEARAAVVRALTEGNAP